MSSTNWTAVVGIGLCLLAAAITVAVAAGVHLAHQWFARQQSQHLKKARILRSQLLSQLRFIEEHLAPRNKPLNPFSQELFEPLQAMWMQADLLEPEEMEAVHRTCRILLLLRKKPTVTKKDVNTATDSIHQTYRVLEEASAKPVRQRSKNSRL